MRRSPPPAGIVRESNQTKKRMHLDQLAGFDIVLFRWQHHQAIGLTHRCQPASALLASQFDAHLTVAAIVQNAALVLHAPD